MAPEAEPGTESVPPGVAESESPVGPAAEESLGAGLKQPGLDSEGGEVPVETKLDDLVTTAKSLGKFSKLLDAATQTNLLEELGEGPYTIFAPTDAAFEKLDAALATRLKEDSGLLSDVLQYHALTPAYSVEELIEKKQITSFAGGDLTIEQTAEGVLVNGIKIEQPGILCTNGVLHVIGEVLIPEDAAPVDEPETQQN